MLFGVGKKGWFPPKWLFLVVKTHVYYMFIPEVWIFSDKNGGFPPFYHCLNR
jgi:hypothetical protein